jgi:hypothetical protein
MSREEILRAIKTQKPNDFYVWDGKSEDDKPLTPKEMADGLMAYKKRDAYRYIIREYEAIKRLV